MKTKENRKEMRNGRLVLVFPLSLFPFLYLLLVHFCQCNLNLFLVSKNDVGQQNANSSKTLPGSGHVARLCLLLFLFI